MFIKRDKKTDCIIAGYAVADQRVKDIGGESFVEVGVGLGKDESGENLPVVSVSIWGRTIAEVHKGDRILACGKLKKTEKDEKVYYSMSAEFVMKENSERKEVPQQSELQEYKDDDLPF